MSETEKVDPELDKLLQEIEDAEEDASTVQEEIAEDSDEDTTTEVVHSEDEQASKEEEPESIAALEKALEENEDQIEEELEPEESEEVTAVATTEEEPESVATVVTDQQKLENSILGLVNKHVNSVEMMMDEAECDRKKIDDILSIILPRIEEGDYKGNDIMAVVSLMQTKTDVSRNRASLMDSIAKLFVSVKNNDSIGMGDKVADDDFSDDELKDLLG